jgi:hypothetical protein
MRAYTLKRFHLDLNMTNLTDADRDDLIAGILKVAPSSPLIQSSPAMQASLALLTTKATTFQTARTTVAASQQKLSADIDAENDARAAIDNEVLALGGLVATGAKTSADVTGSGFNERPPPPPKLPFAGADVLDIRFPGKLKGQFRVSPHGAGNARTTWIVQMSPDPIGPNTWIEVVGPGKSRTITGASGSKVWIRYAMVRGSQQSAWGTPVLVTIP